MTEDVAGYGPPAADEHIAAKHKDRKRLKGQT
jgi:hypothetical protein